VTRSGDSWRSWKFSHSCLLALPRARRGGFLSFYLTLQQLRTGITGRGGAREPLWEPVEPASEARSWQGPRHQLPCWRKV